MRSWRLWAGSALALTALTAAAIAATLFLTLPPAHETLNIAGLSAPVSISFDSYGIPRIQAQTEADAALALGYVHARDRLFQMELMRRAASGRLSEIAGPATLPIDKMARILGERQHAERAFAKLSPDAQTLLRAYSAGVNAWIKRRGRFAGLEFLALGQPEPWEPSQCLLWSETVALWLSDNWHTELARAALSSHMPLAKILELWPAQTPLSPDGTQVPIRQGALDAWPRFPQPFTLPAEASNAWAVNGSHTSTGAPLLAGDPHLRFGFPGLWYLARIETPGHVLVGATAPGVPFMILGRNESIAWTFTASGIDTQDVFQETPLPGGFYATPDGPRRFEKRWEFIRVRGGPQVVLQVRTTRHGPVISDLDGKQGDPVLAVQMENLQTPSGAEGLLALNHAQNVAEAGRAARYIFTPVQNLTVADRHEIGLFTTGIVPIRKSGDGATIVAGADGAHDWVGAAAGDALPHFVDPTSGVLVNANERTAPPDFPIYLGRDWAETYRARRIHTLLDGQNHLTLENFTAMQRDATSVFAQDMSPVWRTLPPQTGPAAQALTLLVTWDGTANADRPEALIFNATLQKFVANVLRDAKVPPEDAGPWEAFAAWLLTPQGGTWCGGDCHPALAESLRQATAKLAARFGSDDPTTWRWGELHKAIFSHPLLGGVPILGRLASRQISVNGDDATLFRGGNGDLGDFTAVHGSSFRGIYDLANLENSRFIIAPGQSGNFLSFNAWNLLHDWSEGFNIVITSSPDRVAQSIDLEP